jgi:hypothetical protein
MPSEELLFQMYQERLDEIHESGYPLWMLELYEHAQPTPPSEQEKPEDHHDYTEHDDLPF